MRPVTAVLLIVSAALAGACCFPSAKSKPASTEPVVVSRDEFKALVMGKTPEEVIAAVGRPDDTEESGGTRDGTWIYKRRTRNPVSLGVDWVWLKFADGKAAKISFI